MKKHVIVTGGAGFVGSSVVDALLAKGIEVTVVDNLDPFYDPELKRQNIRLHQGHSLYHFTETDITDLGAIKEALGDRYDAIIHLAAKVGVRESVAHPLSYSKTNTEGTLNLLNFAVERNIRRFVFASSSSVYGINPHVPWKEDTEIDAIISPYAVSKRAAELYGLTFSKLFDLHFVVLRLFTVYGPRQRPDLAVNKFVNEVMSNRPVKIYGQGDSSRDYTYVTDVADAFVSALDFQGNRFEIFSIGHSNPVSLMELIQKIERTFGVTAQIEFTGMQTGDVPTTFADISKAQELLIYSPKIDIDKGLKLYKAWLEGRP